MELIEHGIGFIPVSRLGQCSRGNDTTIDSLLLKILCSVAIQRICSEPVPSLALLRGSVRPRLQRGGQASDRVEGDIERCGNNFNDDKPCLFGISSLNMNRE